MKTKVLANPFVPVRMAEVSNKINMHLKYTIVGDVRRCVEQRGCARTNKSAPDQVGDKPNSTSLTNRYP